MQMSETLALIQVVAGIASLIVEIVALTRGNPPKGGSSQQNNDED